jgi:hypothetical protein
MGWVISALRPTPTKRKFTMKTRTVALLSSAVYQIFQSVVAKLHQVDRHDDRGQSTAEYALLLLGAATIALIVVTWASGTGKIGELFDAVVDSIIGKV